MTYIRICVRTKLLMYAITDALLVVYYFLSFWRVLLSHVCSILLFVLLPLGFRLVATTQKYEDVSVSRKQRRKIPTKTTKE
jgi:hypothetical protein